MFIKAFTVDVRTVFEAVVPTRDVATLATRCIRRSLTLRHSESVVPPLGWTDGWHVPTDRSHYPTGGARPNAAFWLHTK